MEYPKKANDLASRSLGEFSVIIELGEERNFHELNETAALIWDLCDGGHTKQQIAEALVGDFEINLDDAKCEVNEFLENLSTRNLIQWKDLPEC